MHSGKITAGNIDQDLYKQIVADLTQAVTTGFNAINPPDTKPYRETINALLSSVHKFSGFKTDAQIKDAAKLMLDADGNIRPFNAFKKDILALNHEYNVTWLKTEYNQAIASSQMAGTWVNIQQDKDTLPLLMYDTVNDGRVRDEHQALNQIIRPVDDIFWKTHYPPNGWGCRCGVRQLNKGVVTDLESVAIPEIPVGFRTNVGETKEALSAEHTYAKGLTKAAKAQITNWVNDQESKTELIVSYKKNGGKVFKHNLVDINASDYNDILTCCNHFARQGNKTLILPKVHVKDPEYKKLFGDLIGTPYEGKCPDFKVNDTYYEFESFTTSDKKNAFKNMLNRGVKQSAHIVLNDCGLEERYMKRIIIGRISQNQMINEVWINFNGNLKLLYKNTKAT